MAPPDAAETPVCLLWDYENVRIPSDFNGYTACSLLRKTAMQFGPVRAFRAYMETELERRTSSTAFRSAMQASGVLIADTPHNGGKEVADKQLIVDLFTFALDHPTATFVLVTGDKDFAYSCSTLRNRRYKVVIICPEAHVHESLRASCDEVIYWRTGVLQLPPIVQKRRHDDARPNPKRLKFDHRQLQQDQHRAYQPPPPYQQPHYDPRSHFPHQLPAAQPRTEPVQGSSGTERAVATIKDKGKGKGKEKEKERPATEEKEQLDAQLADMDLTQPSSSRKKSKGKRKDKSKKPKRVKQEMEVIELISSDDEMETVDARREESEEEYRPPPPSERKRKPPGRPHTSQDAPITPIAAIGSRRSSAASKPNPPVSSDADDLIIVSSVRRPNLRPRSARGSISSKLAAEVLPSSAMDTTDSHDEDEDRDGQVGAEGRTSSEERVNRKLVGVR